MLIEFPVYSTHNPASFGRQRAQSLRPATENVNRGCHTQGAPNEERTAHMNDTTAHRLKKLDILLAVGLVCMVSLQVHAAKSPALDPAVQKIVGYSFGESREALNVVADMVKSSLDKPAQCLELEKQFVAVLESDATYDAKDFVCRQLWIMGTKESVRTLAKMLPDREMSDMARYALQQNSCREAGDALIGAMKKVKDTAIRTGIINSVGERRDEKAVSALGKLALDRNADIATAAVAALGKTACPKSVKALQKARSKAADLVRSRASRALLVAADTILAGGDRDGAAVIFQSLCFTSEPVQIRKSALVGLEACLFD